MTLELTADGLQTQTQAEIVADLVERLQAVFGPNIQTKASSNMGQLINILSELRALDQQALLAVYRSFDPNGAIARALDARLGLTGSTRGPARSSVVDGELTFSAAATMNNGDLIRNDDNDTLWSLSDGPHTAVGPFPEVIAAQFSAVDTGPILANAGTTWSAVTGIAGLVGFANPTDDATIGQDQESDADARQRRQRELYAQGQGPLATIQGAVSRVEGVVFVRAYHNPSISPADSDGIPFKAFNVVVETQPSIPPAELQQAIWDAIWSATGAGGEAYGTDYVGSVVDSEGTVQPSAFDVVTPINIVLEIDLATSASEDPITPNIETIVAERILKEAVNAHTSVGRDVRSSDYQSIVGEMLDAADISGVDAVIVCRSISPAAPAAVNKLAVGIREKPDFDSANLTVAQV